MANLSNLDETVNIIIKLCSVYDEGKTAHETWLRTELSIFSKTINIEIGNNIGLMVNLYEAEELLRELQSLVDAYYRKEKQDITFCNNEMNFDFNMELLLEDDVVEIEMWINTANRTKGDIYGYDEGIRFVSGINQLERFIEDYKEELHKFELLLDEKRNH